MAWGKKNFGKGGVRCARGAKLIKMSQVIGVRVTPVREELIVSGGE